jgi:hypothetical protein
MFPSVCIFIVLVVTVSLHVSTFMAIFRCVGYVFSYALRILLRCFLLLFLVHTLHVFHLWPRGKEGREPKKATKSSEAESFNILHTWRWPCRPKHVVRQWRTNTIKLHADRNITCNTHWTMQCSRMLKYSIMCQFLSDLLLNPLFRELTDAMRPREAFRLKIM